MAQIIHGRYIDTGYAGINEEDNLAYRAGYSMGRAGEPIQPDDSRAFSRLGISVRSMFERGHADGMADYIDLVHKWYR